MHLENLHLHPSLYIAVDLPLIVFLILLHIVYGSMVVYLLAKIRV